MAKKSKFRGDMEFQIGRLRSGLMSGRLEEVKEMVSEMPRGELSRWSGQQAPTPVSGAFQAV